jgi:UDP-2-acetamido-3-amino-2,3-dideoxy-glucuronate N-acetyltransferase
VRAGARIGARCVLGQNVSVAATVRVGDGCRVQNNVSLYDGVVLDDDVFVGPAAVFTNIKRPRAFRDQRAAFVTTRVGRGATIGANATVVCGISVGAYAFVAAGAVVTHDVPPHALVMGVPAVWTGWVCRCGVTLSPGAPSAVEAAADRAEQSDAAAADPLWICPGCADRYRLRAGHDLARAAPALAGA